MNETTPNGDLISVDLVVCDIGYTCVTRTSVIMSVPLLLVLFSVPVLFVMYWYGKYLIKGKGDLTKELPTAGHKVTTPPHSGDEDDAETDDDGSPQRVLALLHESVNRKRDRPRVIVWD